MHSYKIRHGFTGDLLGVIEAVDAVHALSAYSVATGFSTYDHEGTADMVYEQTPEKASATYLNYEIVAVQVVAGQGFYVEVEHSAGSADVEVFLDGAITIGVEGNDDAPKIKGVNVEQFYDSDPL